MLSLRTFVLLCSCLGCTIPNRAEPKDSMKLYFDERDNTKMEAEVRRFIAEGMPIEQAKQIMEENGFECERRSNWRDKPPHLCCSRVYPHPWKWRLNHLLLADVIDVHLYHEGGTVKGIERSIAGQTVLEFTHGYCSINSYAAREAAGWGLEESLDGLGRGVVGEQGSGMALARSREGS